MNQVVGEFKMKQIYLRHYIKLLSIFQIRSGQKNHCKKQTKAVEEEL